MSDKKPSLTTSGIPSNSQLGARANGGRGRGYGRGSSGYGGKYTTTYRQKRANNLQSIINTDKEFKGKVEELGVIGLPSERNLKHGATLTKLRETVATYVGTKWDKGSDLKPLIIHMQKTERYIEEPSDITPSKDEEPGKYEMWRNKVAIYDKK